MTFNIFKFFKKQEIIDDGVVIVEHINPTEFTPSNKYEFFHTVKDGLLNVSEGIGTSTVEINYQNEYGFYRNIKVDDEGNIKIKYK